MSKIKIFALGGLNEIGKNMYVVDVDNDLFVFDAGLKYSGDNMLGVDYIIPNYDYLKENKDRIKGLFITHGHDEQMGAIPDIMIDYPEIPIYATTFTLEIIKRELDEEKIKYHNLHEIKAHHKINFGKFRFFSLCFFIFRFGLNIISNLYSRRSVSSLSRIPLTRGFSRISFPIVSTKRVTKSRPGDSFPISSTLSSSK